MAVNRKEAIKNFMALDAKIAEMIKPLKTHPQLLSAGGKLTQLQEQLAAVEKQINLFYQGPSQAAAAPCAEDDAKKILGGVSPAELPGQSRDTAIENLRRQKAALSLAVAGQQDVIRTLWAHLIRDGCEQLKPIAEKYVRAVLDAFEQLERAIKEQEVFFAFLSHMGYQRNMRPAHWGTHPLEIKLLFGGDMQPTLPWYIEQRKQAWGFKTSEKNQKSI